MNAMILKTLINSIAPKLKDVKPENNVASFVEINAKDLFSVDEESKEVADMFIKVMIGYANQNPLDAVTKMKRFADAFTKFYERGK